MNTVQVSIELDIGDMAAIQARWCMEVKDKDAVYGCTWNIPENTPPL